jgi:hypothetical protein
LCNRDIVAGQRMSFQYLKWFSLDAAIWCDQWETRFRNDIRAQVFLQLADVKDWVYFDTFRELDLVS